VYSNPFVAQLVAKEAIEDSMRRAEQVRLVRAVEGVRKPWRWHLPKLSAFKSMLDPVFRPQFKHRVKT
jgi:hypothetical protein